MAFVAVAALAACGSDTTTPDDRRRRPPRRRRTYAPVKHYLLDHTERLQADTPALQRDAEAYYALADQADFDYARCSPTRRAEVRGSSSSSSGLPRREPRLRGDGGRRGRRAQLADYDVIIDAGGDASDPENAVPFSI